MSRVYRDAGTNGRVAQFCERCGKVAGPLPFGRGDVLLTMTLSGSYCDTCIPRVTQQMKPAVVRIARVSQRRSKKSAVNLQLVLDYIDAL